MKALAFSPAAEADLSTIWDYSAEHWGLERADRYVDALRDGCLALASGFKRGRSVDVRAGYRKHPVQSHVIFYREQEDRLVIVRILHARQDVDRHLLR